MNTVIIVGSARCLWDDLSRCPAGLPVMAVNYAGLSVPRVDHHISAHPKAIGLIAQLRRVSALVTVDTPMAEVHSIDWAPGVTRVWPEPTEGGTSALFAVRVGLQLYDNVILAGVPLDATGRFHDAPNAPYFDAGDGSYEWWERAAKDFGGRVRSCSGWTRELLGGVDA